MYGSSDENSSLFEYDTTNFMTIAPYGTLSQSNIII